MSGNKYIDASGVRYLWQKIKETFVQKESGKGLSEQNYTSSEKEKLASLQNYQLPVSSSNTLGGVKIGEGLEIDQNGVLRAIGGGSLSGSLETKTSSGEWGNPGTYIHLIYSDSNIYINVGGLIEYVVSGSQAGDDIVINIDPQHRVTATVSNGSITEEKLSSEVLESLNLSKSSVQNISEGDNNGQIKVDNVNINVHGLGTAAFTSANDYEISGAASNVLGNSSDSSSEATVYGVKQYASEVYDAVQSLTHADIDAVFNG